MSILYGLDSPAITEDDFLEILEEFGRDCERYRFKPVDQIDDDYGFRNPALPTIVDDCDSLTGWSAIIGNAPTLDTTNFKQGTASINGGCSTLDSGALYRKDVTIFDGTDKWFYVWVWLNDTSLVDNVIVSLSDSTGGSYTLQVPIANLSRNWNLIGGKISDWDIFPPVDITQLQRIEISFDKVSGVEIPQGAIKFDYFRYYVNEINYDFDPQTVIIVAVTERDAKLIEAGFANIGDFKVFAPYSYDIQSRDYVYDPIKNMMLELIQVKSNPVIQVTGICKIFVAKVSNRQVPP